MPGNKRTRREFLQGAAWIFAIAALAYLPLASRLGYLNDDWYLMYDMQVKGADFFREIFAIDRPGRALLMRPLFELFKFSPLPYQLSAFAWRVLGGLCLYWTIRMIWSERKFLAWSTALLFTIYPGFLAQPNAIDYQSHIAGLFLALLSVGLSVQAVVSEKGSIKAGSTAAAILAGWGALSQMEYFIGVEFLRFGCIAVLIWRRAGEGWREKAIKVLRTSLPFLAIGGGFLFWRLFMFESVRKATDANLQISQLFSSPLTGLWWLNYLLQDSLTVSIGAWSLPLYLLAFPMRLKDMGAGLGLAVVAVGGALAGMRMTQAQETSLQNKEAPELNREAVLISLIAIVGGLLPVILVNRHVTLPDYSRYTLIASVGAALLMGLLIERIKGWNVQGSVLGVLVLSAILTHYGNTIRFVTETEATRNFWWQVSWRAPNIQEGVTLIASYPGSPLAEDYFIWGPANLIYHPEQQENNPVRVKLPAGVLTAEAIQQITSQGELETPLRRGNYLERDFGNVLVMIQSKPNGCVRFINGQAPELSSVDEERLILIAPHSRLEAIQTEGEAPTPLRDAFGKEPEHGWCYTYQKADLARQRGDWKVIPQLLQTAMEKGYYPDDGVEWMPFLQAFAVLGENDSLRSTLKIISADKTLRVQACQVMTEFAGQQSLSNEVLETIEKNLCKQGKP